jgi:hypothetical protein
MPEDFYVFRDFSTTVLKDRLRTFCITGDEVPTQAIPTPSTRG